MTAIGPIETTRLVLEPLTLEQAELFSRDARDAQPWAPDFPTDGDLRQAHILSANSARAVRPENAWGPYTLVEKSSGLFIGGIGFKGRPDGAGDVEIGYGICVSRQGQGLMTEAAIRMCEVASELGALSVSAETDAANVASQRVLEKSGFEQFKRDDASIWWRVNLATS